MTTRAYLALGLLLLMGPGTPSVVVGAQATQRPPISNPGVVAPPTWWRTVSMPDGRTFVTDGGFSIDASLLKAAPPANLENIKTPAIAKFLEAPYEKETALSDLAAGKRPNTFDTPDGIVLNGNYVTFLRTTLPPARVRLRTNGLRGPVVVVLDGKPVGVMMPVQPPSAQIPG